MASNGKPVFPNAFGTKSTTAKNSSPMPSAFISTGQFGAPTPPSSTAGDKSTPASIPPLSNNGVAFGAEPQGTTTQSSPFSASTPLKKPSEPATNTGMPQVPNADWSPFLFGKRTEKTSEPIANGGTPQAKSAPDDLFSSSNSVVESSGPSANTGAEQATSTAASVFSSKTSTTKSAGFPKKSVASSHFDRPTATVRSATTTQSCLSPTSGLYGPISHCGFFVYPRDSTSRKEITLREVETHFANVVAKDDYLATPVYTFVVGPTSHVFTLHVGVLKQSAILLSKCNTACNSKIEMPDEDAETMSHIFRFLYTGRCIGTHDGDPIGILAFINLANIYEAAVKYQVPDLGKLIIDCMDATSCMVINSPKEFLAKAYEVYKDIPDNETVLRKVFIRCVQMMRFDKGTDTGHESFKVVFEYLRRGGTFAEDLGRGIARTDREVSL